jgi:ribosome-associated protein
MQQEALQKVIISSLEELKANNIQVLDLHSLSTFTDVMVIASGQSTRHVKALASKVIEKSKLAGVRPLGVEGQQEAEWILLDLNDILVHVMLPQVRDFYKLEKLWQIYSDGVSQRTDNYS